VSIRIAKKDMKSDKLNEVFQICIVAIPLKKLGNFVQSRTASLFIFRRLPKGLTHVLLVEPINRTIVSDVSIESFNNKDIALSKNNGIATGDRYPGVTRKPHAKCLVIHSTTKHQRFGLQYVRRWSSIDWQSPSRVEFCQEKLFLHASERHPNFLVNPERE